MRKRKLIRLLQTLEPEELISFEAFVRSPYFNKDEEVLALFCLLKSFYPGFENRNLNKEEVYGKLFPGEIYEDKRLRYLMSNLTKLGEQFLAIQKIQDTPFQTRLAMLESLSERGLNKNYRQVFRNLGKDMETLQVDSSEFFLAQLKWSEIQERHFERQRLRKFDASIQDAARHLDRYYFLHRLKLACGMLDRQAIVQADYQVNLSEEWIKHLEEQQFFGEPIIQAYYSIYQALLNEEAEQHFSTLKKFIRDHEAAITPQELKEVYLFAINYCARKIRQGREKYVQEALTLYRAGIETGVLVKQGILSPWAFTNVVKLSLRLQYYDWIESFIQTYAPKLPETFRDNALHYNLAELYYYTQRFEEAQEHLKQVVFSDMNYYLGARVLLAKIYYETDELEPLLSLLSSFTVFLKRNKKLSGDLKRTYLNFCQILFQIVRRSPSRLAPLKAEIQSTELLTDRKWLTAVFEKKEKG